MKLFVDHIPKNQGYTLRPPGTKVSTADIMTKEKAPNCIVYPSAKCYYVRERYLTRFPDLNFEMLCGTVDLLATYYPDWQPDVYLGNKESRLLTQCQCINASYNQRDTLKKGAHH
jgi:hypothetical protein